MTVSTPVEVVELLDRIATHIRSAALAYNRHLDFSPAFTRLEAHTNLLVSGNLRASATFGLYAALMRALQHPARLRPYELPAIDEEGWERLISAYRQTPTIESLMISDPFKIRALDVADRVTDRAQAVGAANLLLRDRDQLVADNFDGIAFEQGLHDLYGIDLDGGSLLVLGAGGVGRAVALHYGSRLTRIDVCDTNLERAEALVADLTSLGVESALVFADLDRDTRPYAAIYNATGLGKTPRTTGTPWLPSDHVTSGQICLDANYTPTKTTFLQHAEVHGATIVNGLPHMLASTALHCSLLWGAPISLNAVLLIARNLYAPTA